MSRSSLGCCGATSSGRASSSWGSCMPWSRTGMQSSASRRMPRLMAPRCTTPSSSTSSCFCSCSTRCDSDQHMVRRYNAAVQICRWHWHQSPVAAVSQHAHIRVSRSDNRAEPCNFNCRSTHARSTASRMCCRAWVTTCYLCTSSVARRLCRCVQACSRCVALVSSGEWSPCQASQVDPSTSPTALCAGADCAIRWRCLRHPATDAAAMGCVHRLWCPGSVGTPRPALPAAQGSGAW